LLDDDDLLTSGVVYLLAVAQGFDLDSILHDSSVVGGWMKIEVCRWGAAVDAAFCVVFLDGSGVYELGSAEGVVKEAADVGDKANRHGFWHELSPVSLIDNPFLPCILMTNA
jgi:hypothetical protein